MASTSSHHIYVKICTNMNHSVPNTQVKTQWILPDQNTYMCTAKPYTLQYVSCQTYSCQAHSATYFSTIGWTAPEGITLLFLMILYSYPTPLWGTKRDIYQHLDWRYGWIYATNINYISMYFYVVLKTHPKMCLVLKLPMRAGAWHRHTFVRFLLTQ